MSYTLGFVVIAAVAVVSFDAIAAVASIAFKVPYRAFRFGSVAIYFMVGYIASLSFGVFFGPIAGAYAGLVDATAGWAVSWWLGPGRPPAAQARWPVIVSTALFVTILAALFGGLGAMLGALVNPQGVQ